MATTKFGRQGAEAPENAPLGQLAFPNFRDDAPFKEVDTEREKELYDTLEQYFDGVNPLGAADVKLIKDILDNEWYTKVFHRPAETIIYRGMIVNRQWLVDAGVFKGRQPGPLGTEWGKIQHAFTFTPWEATSAWTTNREVAITFSNEPRHDMDEPMYSVVLTAWVSDNPYLIVCSGGLYNVNGLDFQSDEDEVLALGDVKVQSVRWEPYGANDSG